MERSVAGAAREVAVTAHQAGWIFGAYAVSGLVDLSIFDRPHERMLLLVSGCFAVIAVTIQLVPSRVWGTRGTTALTVALLLALGLVTSLADEGALLLSSACVMTFTWMGFHQSVRSILLAAPLAAVTYGSGLRLAGVPDHLAGSALLIVPVSALIGVVISKIVAEARNAKAEVKAEERWRAAMMATLAHDVRSPLTSITGVLEVVSDDPRTPASHRSLIDGANRQAARILRLATGLLDVERVEQGRLVLDRRHLNLLDLLNEIATTHPGLMLVLDIPQDLVVWADRERLEQIVVNLANNAARHGSPPLVVAATSTPSGLTISVRDYGPGVPAEDVPHLFERFSSADRAPQSVGLGLWIVRLLTPRHMAVRSATNPPTPAQTSSCACPVPPRRKQRLPSDWLILRADGVPSRVRRLPTSGSSEWRTPSRLLRRCERIRAVGCAKRKRNRSIILR